MFGRNKTLDSPPVAAPPVVETRVADISVLPPAPRLGDMLITEGHITEQNLKDAIKYQKENGGFLGQLLVQLGYVTQSQVASVLVKQCKIPHLSLLDYDISNEVLKLVPRELCQRRNLLPIDKLGRILTVAMVDPLDNEALEEVRAYCPDLRIKPILCNWEHFDLVSRRLFGDAKGGERETITAKSLGLSTRDDAPRRLVPANDVEESIPDVAQVPVVTQVPAEEMPPPPPPAPFVPEVMLPPAPGASAAEIGAMIRDAVNQAMQSVLAQLGGQVREMVATHEPPAEEMMALMRDTVREVLASTQQSNATQESRLEKIAAELLESAQQASQLVETAVVNEGNRRALRQGASSRHASVAKFQDALGRPAGQRIERELTDADAEILEALDSEQPLEKLTFENFYSGPANAFTLKISQAVAENPGGQYNPFFLFGSVGLGKTHLISAIGNEILKKDLQKRVGYISASQFSRRLAEAAKDEAIESFRENYSQWDVLILDDIQFLGGHIQAQEEFFHIFNALHQKQRQIIIASDKAPDRLGLMEQRLVSRFGSGIVAEVKPPDREARLQILRNQIRAGLVGGEQITEEILSLIALRVPYDVRKMVGSLKKVTAYANLLDQPLTFETADEILQHMGIGEAA